MAEATGAPDRTSPARRGTRLDPPSTAPAHGARSAPARPLPRRGTVGGRPLTLPPAPRPRRRSARRPSVRYAWAGSRPTTRRSSRRARGTS